MLGNYMHEEQRIGLLKNLFTSVQPGGALGMSVPMAPPSGVIHNKYISGPLRRPPKGIFVRRASTLRYDAEQYLLNGEAEGLVRLPYGEQRFGWNYAGRLISPVELLAMLH